MTQIPEEAVVAATKVAWARYGVRSDPSFVRALLKAATPHLMRAAWDEGWEAHGDWGGPTLNPYVPKCHELPTTL